MGTFNNFNFRIFLFIQNPVVSYAMTKDLFNSEKNNLLIRSILCKPYNVTLNMNDVKIAKNVCDANLVDYNYRSMKKIFKRYDWKENTDRCRQKYLKHFRELNYHVDAGQLKRIIELNAEDMSIYNDFVR